MIRSELAFIPNNISSHSLQMTNFIEEEASEDNSEQKSSHVSKKQEQQSQKNGSKNSSFMHDQSQSHHRQKMANAIQGLQWNIQGKNSILDTPVNLFNKPLGKYEFTPQAFPSEEQLLVEAITTQLNQIQRNQNKFFASEIQAEKKQQPNPKRISVKSQHEDVKVINPMQDFQTDYSDISRDMKINEHRYESNLALLSDQTKELLSYYELMIQQEEHRQLRKKVMMLQIHNHRTKISLRNASYTKRFNYISPIPKNNDRPLQFKAKFQVEGHLVDRLQELAHSIKQEQKVWEQQQARLTLLTKYYNIIKSRTITNLIQNQADYRYDSKLQRFTNRQNSIKNSAIAIDIPTTTNGFNITPASSIHGTNNFARQSPVLKKGLSHPQKLASPKKAAEPEITEPYQKYNLLRYKTEISKEMMVEYEVYNLGRLKRIKDQNRMIKKQLQFIEEHIQHFDKSFAEEMKKYEEMAKPKITYETFQSIEQDTPFTKSPFSRDYLGNTKGCNTINLYRPDSKDPKLLKSHSKSRASINKSLSQSKYTIKRDQTINLSNSKRDITLSQNLLTQNDERSDKSDTVVSFFRNRVNSPDKAKRSQNCIYTSKKQLAPIKEKPLNYSKKSIGKRQLSPRSKNLLRFSHQSQTEKSLGRRAVNSPRISQKEDNGKLQTPSKNPVSSQYCLSSDAENSKK